VQGFVGCAHGGWPCAGLLLVESRKSCTPPQVTDGDLVREMGFTKAQVKKLRKAIANLPGLLRESFAAIAPRHHRGGHFGGEGYPGGEGRHHGSTTGSSGGAAATGAAGSDVTDVSGRVHFHELLK